MRPELVSALVLFNTTARYLQADDYPIGAPPEAVDALVQIIATGWGTDELTRSANPSMADDAEWIRFTSRAIRSSATPRTAAAQFNYILRNDVREALPLIQAPTLVLHVGASVLVPITHGRYLAEHIDGATFVELPGGDSTTTPELYVIADEVAEFLTGERPVVEIERVLTTMLFTDIVGSTERAASLGDERWRVLLDAHDRTVRDQLGRHRGREVETSGDSFFASFDGPARAIRCAQAIVKATGTLGVELRVGLHTGECEVRGDHLGGLAVHIAARVGALAASGEVLVSGTVKDLVVGSGIEFIDRGEHQLKGVPGSWKLFAVVR
jgi:class 3 adenylate cyclase